MRVLITGASGFVGGHLVEACVAAGETVFAASRSGGLDVTEAGSVRTVSLDLLDGEATDAVVAETAPQVIYHLAGLASVARSWEEPQRTLQENATVTLNLLEAARKHAPHACLVLASSGEVYGRPATLPVDEDAPLRPQSPYAVAKVTAEMLGGLYADAHDLRVVGARAFNHAGPRQATTYAIASFARQVAAGQLAGERPVRLVTGNPDARRDFTDVRDVVRAYRLLAEHGEAGVYNVCSGRSTSISELITMLAAAAGVEVSHDVDPARLRPHDVAEVRGSHARLTAATGWRPEIPLERTLADTLVWWRGELASGRVDSPHPPE